MDHLRMAIRPSQGCIKVSAPGLPDLAGIKVMSFTTSLAYFVKLACADLLLFMVMVQAPGPAQAPDQLTKRKPDSGVACNVIVAPDAKLAAQVFPQLINPPAPLISPLPPEALTESW